MAPLRLSPCSGAPGHRRGGDGCGRREDVADEDAGVVRRQRRTGQIGADERDGDRRARITGVRRQARDRRRTDATRVACNGQQIADRVVGIRRDVPLPVDHLGEPAEVVVDVLRLLGDRQRRY